MKIRCSLHRTRAGRECDLCGCVIQAKKPPDYAEFWRVKGGGHDPSIPRILCCFCHAVYGFPTDGWTHSPDGREVMAAAVPEAAT